jgi:glycosyltransferase involved in cell wall biosynthesis
MHIAINAAYRMHGGGQTHLKHLLDTWCKTGVDREHTISLFTRAENLCALQGVLSRQINIHPVGKRAMTLAAKLMWEQLVLPGILARSNLDVLLCPGGMVPLRSPIPTVVTFHNAGPFCPSTTVSSMGPYDWLWLKVLGVLMRRSALSARRVIFISRYFKDLFVRRFRFPAERGDVIYHGRDTLRMESPKPTLLRQLGVRAPYLLCVSHLYPYKNLPALIEGYALARQTLQAKGLQLALVGKARHESYHQRLQELIRQRALDDWVVLTGGVEHQAIGSLLGGCAFFVFQSTCENCPTTLIEALAAGVPIACSSAGVMPEIAGDAALYFDPCDPEDIAGVLIRLAEETSLQPALRQKALQQSLQFPTWDEVGQMTLHSLRRAVDDC